MTDLPRNENPGSANSVHSELPPGETLPPSAVPLPVQSYPRRWRRLRNRFLAGGLLAGVVTLAMFLSPLFDGPGLGSGSGGEPGLGNESRKTDSSQATSNPAKIRSDVVEVQLDDSRFQLRRTDGTVVSAPVSIAEIVQRAEKAHGDDRRVRVRVFLRYNAILSRWDDLREALEQSGLTSRDIAMKKLED